MLASFDATADHRDVETTLRSRGWTPCGEGDWAIALAAPDGGVAARITPFDPTAPYTAELYRRAAPTGQVPALYDARALSGGGHVMLMELVDAVEAADAETALGEFAEPTPAWAELAEIVTAVHDQARRDLPWCGPLDRNPHNVRRGADGRLVLMDLFYADGPNLYATARTDPAAVVAAIPAEQRRFLADIPAVRRGDPAERAALVAGLTAADLLSLDFRHNGA